MQSLSIFIIQADSRAGDLLAANLRTHFREIHRLSGLRELRRRFSQNDEPLFAAVRRCHEVVHEMGAPRIFTVMKLGTRTDRTQTMALR